MLESDIRSKTVDNYRVAADIIRLNEEISAMLSRFSGVLNHIGYADNSPHSTAVNVGTGNNTGSSIGGAGDIGSSMIGIEKSNGVPVPTWWMQWRNSSLKVPCLISRAFI